MSHEFTDEELAAIKEDCMFWANNCGGCETCIQTFKNPPLYDHQETFTLVKMIENLKRKISELEKDKP
jgi:hypothetical protein